MKDSAHTIEVRTVHLHNADDTRAELQRMGVDAAAAGPLFQTGREVQIRCSGLSATDVRTLQEWMGKLSGACVAVAKRGEALLVGSRRAFEQVVRHTGEYGGGLQVFRERLEQLLKLPRPRTLQLNCRGRRLDLGRKTQVMGILNCTPDSFYAGSRLRTAADAIEVGRRMVEDGADILDVGGESTRPGSDPVPLEEELRRVLPVIEALAAETEVPISVDTYKADVAREALRAGAHMVNDVSGLRFDPGMVEVVAEFGVPVVIMHMRGRPKDMQVNPHYRDLMVELYRFFQERIVFCEQGGIGRDRVVIDPGIGFGKRYEHNYEILRRLRELADLGQPLLIGPSRKAFLGAALDLPPEQRLHGTAAAVTVAILNGAHIVRVHDVPEMGQVARIADVLAGKTALGDSQ